MKSITYIIILNYNAWQETLECLESVYRLKGAEYRVVLCDNASINDSVDKIKSWVNGSLNVEWKKQVGTYSPANDDIRKPTVTREIICTGNEIPDIEPKENELIILKATANLGYSGGNNLGVRFALSRMDCGYVWILNNDTVVAGDALEKMLYTVAKKNYGGISSTVCYYDRPETIQLVGSRLDLENFTLQGVGSEQSVHELADNIHLEMLAGPSFLLTRECMSAVGGMLDESYFLYCEEMELAQRINKSGFALGYAKDSFVYHKGNISAGKKSTAYRDYHVIRSWAIFIRRYYPKYWLKFKRQYTKLMYKRIMHVHLKRAWAIYTALRDGQSIP